jgi:hypothetical protein
MLLLLGGCAIQPALKLLDQIPPPPKHAAAAVTRCGDHKDHALGEIAAQLAALQRQEWALFNQVSTAAQAANDNGTGYAQRHPQAAQALRLREDDISQAAGALTVRMEQSAATAVRTLDGALDAIEGSERRNLALCVLTLQDSRWLPEPTCAAPVHAEAKATRDAAADRFLDSAQQVWLGWREDAEHTMQGWTKLSDEIPDAGDPYVQTALAGYRHSQEEVLQQLMRASTNLCGIAARAASKPDPIN